jgi:type IV fimbrial biogenesis protein FimT
MKKQEVAGFTLIELMVALAIAGILAAMAGPSFVSLVKNSRLTTATNDLTADLASARSEAGKRGVRIALCPSANGSSCGGTDWNVGRIMFVDLGNTGSVDAGDEILRVTGASASGVRLTSSTFANAGFIQFRPMGMSDSAGVFKICDDRTGNLGRTLGINSTGRANLTKKVACP